MGLSMAVTSMPQSTRNNIVPTVRAYVVHDPTTGEVLHIHHAVTFPHDRSGGESSEARALRLAGRRAGAGAVVLEVDPNEVSFDRRPIKVDIASSRIVRV
jgi:hypothetical protein